VLSSLLWLLVAAWVLLGLSWVALHQVIVPRVGEWRPTLERIASDALGVKVEIGALQANSSGPVPSLHLRDVVLRDASGAEALRLPSVRAALSLHSLWRLGFDQLIVERPVLDLRRSADGRLLLGGIDLGDLQQNGAGSPLADWLLAQTELAILQGTVRWHDDTRADTGPLVLTGIDWVVRHSGRKHQFRLDASPPPAWGQRFSVQAEFTRPWWQTGASPWRHWSGTLYADLPWIDLQQLGRYVDTPGWLGLQVQQGQGAARLWLDWQRGAPHHASADLGRKLRPGSIREKFEMRFERKRRSILEQRLQFDQSTLLQPVEQGDGRIIPGRCSPRDRGRQRHRVER